MKKTNLKSSMVKAFTILGVGMMIAGCAMKQKVKGETLISTYCADDEHLSDKDNIRATGIGESMDQMTAKKKARSNAQAELAKTINSTMKIVGDNYVNSTEVNNKEELTETFQEMTRTIVNEEIKGAVKICEKYTKTENNNYKCYMALELSGAELLQKYNERLSNDDRIKADYNYEKFKETFEKEMEEFEK